jgi:hypothetical protein
MSTLSRRVETAPPAANATEHPLTTFEPRLWRLQQFAMWYRAIDPHSAAARDLTAQLQQEIEANRVNELARSTR